TESPEHSAVRWLLSGDWRDARTSGASGSGALPLLGQCASLRSPVSAGELSRRRRRRRAMSDPASVTVADVGQLTGVPASTRRRWAEAGTVPVLAGQRNRGRCGLMTTAAVPHGTAAVSTVTALDLAVGGEDARLRRPLLTVLLDLLGVPL